MNGEAAKKGIPEYSRRRFQNAHWQKSKHPRTNVVVEGVCPKIPIFGSFPPPPWMLETDCGARRDVCGEYQRCAGWTCLKWPPAGYWKERKKEKISLLDQHPDVVPLILYNSLPRILESMFPSRTSVMMLALYC